MTKSSDRRKHRISIYDKGGNIVKTFESVNEATEYIGADITQVSKAAHGRSKTCKGYVVSLGDDKAIESFVPTNTDKRTIIQYDSENNEVREWESIHEASRGVGCDPSNISKCLSGKKKTCKGFVWRYKK